MSGFNYPNQKAMNLYSAQNAAGKYGGQSQGWYKGPSNYVQKVNGGQGVRFMCPPSGGGGCGGGKSGGCGGGGCGGGAGGCGGGKSGGCSGGCGGGAGGGCGSGGNQVGRMDSDMVYQTRVSKQYISRQSFNLIRTNLRKTRIGGGILVLFSALSVALGIACLLFYHFGLTTPMAWCTTPHPISALNVALASVAPGFNYFVAISGFMALPSLICGLVTTRVTKIYGTASYAAMYLSFISLPTLFLMFVFSLMCFLMTFGLNGAAPTCTALSVVSFLVLVHAVVCSLILWIIYLQMSKFLKKLKMDPSVDLVTLKKYYGRRKLTVIDYDDDDYEDDQDMGCCGGYCCDDGEYDEETDDSSDEDEYENEQPRPQRNFPSACGQQVSHHQNHHHNQFSPSHHHHRHQAKSCQASNHGQSAYAVAGYPFAQHKQVYGHAHMAGRYNPCGASRKF